MKVNDILEKENINFISDKSLNSPLNNSDKNIDRIKSIYNDEVRPDYNHVLLKCKNCDDFNNRMKTNDALLPLNYDINLPANLPLDVKNLYNQAHSYYITDPQKAVQSLQMALNKAIEYYKDNGEILSHSVLNGAGKDSKEYNRLVKKLDALNTPITLSSNLSNDDLRHITRNMFNLFDEILRLNSTNAN